MKKQKRTSQEKGITLVALIITIIVLLILAVVTINAVKGDGIIQYANDAAYKYNQAATNEQAMLDSYIGKMEDYLPKVVHSGIVPKGAVYTTGRVWDEDSYSWDESNVVTLNEGDIMPEEPQKYDMYIYGDYRYIYEGWLNPGGYAGDSSSSEAGRWDAQVIDTTKSEYGDILLSINNKPLRTKLDYTWFGCSNMTKLVIPEGVTHADGIASSDSALKTLTIPSSFEGVYSLPWAFGEGTLEDIYYDGTIADFEKILNNSVRNGPGWGYTLNCTLHLSDGSSVVINYELETKMDESGNVISRKYVSKS